MQRDRAGEVAAVWEEHHRAQWTSSVGFTQTVAQQATIAMRRALERRAPDDGIADALKRPSGPPVVGVLKGTSLQVFEFDGVASEGPGAGRALDPPSRIRVTQRDLIRDRTRLDFVESLGMHPEWGGMTAVRVRWSLAFEDGYAVEWETVVPMRDRDTTATGPEALGRAIAAALGFGMPDVPEPERPRYG
jgi:hypothetical protein